jgi:hypothetical protein
VDRDEDQWGHPSPGLGVVFDIDELGGGLYGNKAWHIFAATVPSTSLCAAVLVEGDTAATLAGHVNEFCIGVYGLRRTIDLVRATFEQAEISGLAAFHRRFIEKTALDQQPLPAKGAIDWGGRLVTEAWTWADHDLCRKSGWGYMPRHIPDDLDETVRKELAELARFRPPLPA